jgi:hypothetical protein
MGQSRLSSLYEALINMAIGYLINFIANIVILPYFFNITVDLWEFFLLGLPYTLVSVVRSYVIRRWFNGKIHAAALKLAGD